jgi:periplasmic protein CpxP/Spy
MKPIATQFLSSTARTVVAAVALLATLALASPASAAPDARSRTDRVEARITMLHAKLAITAAQEPAWQNLIQVMRGNAQTMEALSTARAAKAPTATAIDDLKSYAEITTAHAEGLKAFLPVFETLYGGMSDAQKAQADTLFRGPQHNRQAAKKMSKAKSIPSASTTASTK